MRPRLLPVAQRSWRDPTTLQFWREPARAVVLSGLSNEFARFLDCLDGTRTLPQLLDQAPHHGLTSRQVERLLEMLAGAGLLEDASIGCAELSRLTLAERDRLTPEIAALSVTRPDAAVAIGRRLAAGVRISDAGAIGAAVATMLATAGVGRIWVADFDPVRERDLGALSYEPADLGKPRSVALAGHLSRLAPSTELSSAPDPDASLTVVVAGPAGAPMGGQLVRNHQPHLHLAAQDAGWQVGPLVIPGHTPCANCLELFRQERDPRWPLVAAQSRTGSCGAVQIASGAAIAAREVLVFLQGDLPATAGGTLELAEPGWQPRRRSWVAHPRCTCGAAAGEPAARGTRAG